MDSFPSLPTPAAQHRSCHCSRECAAARPWPGPQTWNCHFHFNFRKIEIGWEVFMQIRKVLRNYLATMLMNVQFLEMNLTFCFSCQKGFCVVVYTYGWLDLTREHLMYFPHGNESRSCLTGGSHKPQWNRFWLGREQSRGGLPHGSIFCLCRHWIPLRDAVHVKLDFFRWKKETY